MRRRAGTNAAHGRKTQKTADLERAYRAGLADRGPAEIAATRAMVAKIREVYERYGFEPVEAPGF